jgi:hypothetical protein
MIFDNALAWRGLKPKLTASSIVFRSILILFILFLVTLPVLGEVFGSAVPPTQKEIAQALCGSGVMCLGVEIIVVMFLSLATLVDSLIMERAKQTIDFVETLPLSPREKIVGLLVGHSGLLLVTGLIFGLFGSVAIAMSGQVSFAPLLLIQVAMIAGWLLFGLFGITVSAMAGRFQLGMILGGVWLILSAVTAGSSSSASPVFSTINPWLWLTALAEYSSDHRGKDVWLWTQHAMFYGHRVFWMVPLLSLYALGIVFFYGTARRALSRPTAPAGSRWGALIYAALGHLLLVGFLCLWLGDVAPESIGIINGELTYGIGSGHDPYEAIMAYLSLAFLAAGIWSMRTTPSFQSTLDWLRRKKGAIAVLKQDSSSPAWLGTLLMGCLAVLAGAVAMSLYHGGVAGWYWIVAGVLLVYLLAYHCLFCVGKLINPRIGAAGGIALIVGWLVLIGLASVTEAILTNRDSVSQCLAPFELVSELVPDRVDPHTGHPPEQMHMDSTVWAGIVAAAGQLLLFAVIFHLRLRSLKRVRPELTPALRPKQKT